MAAEGQCRQGRDHYDSLSEVLVLQGHTRARVSVRKTVTCGWDGGLIWWGVQYWVWFGISVTWLLVSDTMVVAAFESVELEE